MANYTYRWVIEEQMGGIRVTTLMPHEEHKRAYVDGILSQALRYANAGWASARYVVYDFLGRDRREYVVLSSNDKTPYSGRYICVNCDSLGAIFEAVGNQIF